MPLREAGDLANPCVHRRRGSFGGATVTHHVEVDLLGEGAVQAVCSCGWRSEVFGTDKTTGTMDPLEQARSAGDLHAWDEQFSV
jgi:hypothetical protein